jgi:hypothetical protein
VALWCTWCGKDVRDASEGTMLYLVAATSETQVYPGAWYTRDPGVPEFHVYLGFASTSVVVYMWAGRSGKPRGPNRATQAVLRKRYLTISTKLAGFFRCRLFWMELQAPRAHKSRHIHRHGSGKKPAERVDMATIVCVCLVCLHLGQSVSDQKKCRECLPA